MKSWNRTIILRHPGADGEGGTIVSIHVAPTYWRRHLDGGGGDLDVVEFAQGALSVDEVGGSQLMQSFQSHSGGIPSVVAHLCLLTQLPLVNKYG